MQHVATGYTGDVQEGEEVWQEWHRAMCAKCAELEEEKQLMSFTSKMSSQNVRMSYKFAYLGNMLNDTGGVEQAVAARVRAALMKFRELGGILCTRGASLRMKGVVY